MWYAVQCPGGYCSHGALAGFTVPWGWPLHGLLVNGLLSAQVEKRHSVHAMNGTQMYCTETNRPSSGRSCEARLTAGFPWQVPQAAPDAAPPHAAAAAG